MRALRDQEIATVYGAFCPLCVSSSAYLLAGTYTSLTGYATKNTFYYFVSATFFSLSAFYFSTHLIHLWQEN